MTIFLYDITPSAFSPQQSEGANRELCSSGTSLSSAWQPSSAWDTAPTRLPTRKLPLLWSTAGVSAAVWRSGTLEEWCRGTASLWTVLGLSGATWTPPTPPVRTWSPHRGSPTIPGHTRPVPPPLTPLPSVSGFPPQSFLSPLSLLPSLLSQWSQSTLRSIPPTLSPSITLSPPPPWRVSEVRHKPSRRYSEPMEDMIPRLSENPDTAMLQARVSKKNIW